MDGDVEMTPKIAETTEVQFEEAPMAEETKVIPAGRSVVTPALKQSQEQDHDELITLNHDEPITLHDIIIHDNFGAPRCKYETVTLDPAPIDSKEMHFLPFGAAYETMAKKEGKEIPSLPLLYAIIEKLHTEKHPAEAGLLAELKKYSFCTSTILHYQIAMITHGSNFPSQYILAEPFPDGYWSGFIKGKMAKTTWHWFMKALLQPRDIDQAMELLQEFGGHPLSVLIPNPNKYEEKNNRVTASFFLSDDTTYLNCSINLNKLTYSRLVTLK